MGLNGIYLKRALLEQGIALNEAKSIHLAIVNEPYLQYILRGKKTIESRFTKNCIAPYKRVFPNDIVLMKRAGQPISSYFIASNVKYYENVPDVLDDLKVTYSGEICADEDFWKARVEKKYITLIKIKEVKILNNSIAVEKKDKRGWVTVNNNYYKKIYLISGSIGSGKTWLSNKISALLKCDRCSFSDYVKWKCEQQGMISDRETLNRIGQKAVSEWLSEFIYFLLNCTTEKTSDILLIDGLRHMEVLSEIDKYCDEYEVIYIDSDSETIVQNLIARNTLEEDSKLFSTEQQLPLIKEKANLIIRNSSEVDTVIEYINRYSSKMEMYE